MAYTRAMDQDMCSGPLLKKIVLFSLPIMAMNLLQLLFNAADMVVVGRYSGSDALAAVGATGALINLLINLFMGLSVGTSVVVAQDYGARDDEGIAKSVHTSIAVSLVSGLFVCVVGIAFCAPMLRLMGTPENIIGLSDLYMRIYFIGVPASMVYNFAAAVLRAVGDSRHPMYYLVITGAMNVLMNLLFVIVFDMSVAGVALATVISQYLSMGLILLFLVRSPNSIRLDFRKLGIDLAKLKSVVRIGLPAGLQNTLFSISNVLIQSAINSFGSALVAANSASGNIEGFLGTTINAYYNAAITFTGQNMGAKKYSRIDRTAKVCTLLIVITWIVLGSLIVLFSGPLLGIYTSDPQVIELGMTRTRIMMCVYVSCAIMNVYPGFTRGMGYSILPMICTLAGACLLRMVWLWTIFARFPTVPILYACYPVTWTVSGIGQLASFFYARKKVRARGDMVEDT